MSTDWNVHCMDCNETHTFDDANHRDVEMAALCKHAAAIAALVPLMEDVTSRGVDLDLGLYGYGRIEPRWFAKHLGHRLVPRSEYGDFMDQCSEYIECVCGNRKRCTLTPNHDGDHSAVPRR